MSKKYTFEVTEEFAHEAEQFVKDVQTLEKENPPEREILTCAFCGKTNEHNDLHMIKSGLTGNAICSDCIGLCYQAGVELGKIEPTDFQDDDNSTDGQDTPQEDFTAPAYPYTAEVEEIPIEFHYKN